MLLISSLTLWTVSLECGSLCVCLIDCCCRNSSSGPGPPHSRGCYITHNEAPQSVGPLWTSDQLVSETSTWQHSKQTSIHAPGGIRTHNLSRRAAADLCLRPRGHWGRLNTGVGLADRSTALHMPAYCLGFIKPYLKIGQMCDLLSLYSACKTGSLSKRNDTESVNVDFMAPFHLKNMIDFHDYSVTLTNRCIQ